MAINGTLGTGITATTNPDPNTLTAKNPGGRLDPDPAWANQSAVAPNGTTTFGKCLIPKKMPNGEFVPYIWLFVKPGDGAAVTWTLTSYLHSKTAAAWAAVESPLASTVSGTGNGVVRIDNPGEIPIYLSPTALSEGSLSIYFDQDTATAV